jgi:hypothetical protein
MYKTKIIFCLLDFLPRQKLLHGSGMLNYIILFKNYICIDYTSNFHTCHHLLLMNDFQYMTYFIYLLGINSWFVCHQPWLWHFLKWNRSIINSRNVDVMYNYGIKRLSKLCKCILAPPVILTTSMHLQCSCMPAKVHYELSRRVLRGGGGGGPP